MIKQISVYFTDNTGSDLTQHNLLQEFCIETENTPDTDSTH